METAQLIIPAGADPRDVILTTTEVHKYLRVKPTLGYQLTGGPLAPYAIAPGRWRLADLHRYQEDKLAGACLPAPVPTPRRADAGIPQAGTLDSCTIPAARRGGRPRKD